MFILERSIMNILVIGDVVGVPGLSALERGLRPLKKELAADFTVVNGENSAMNGTIPKHCQAMLDAGADVITLGNHALRKQQIVPFLEDNPYVLRPANLAPQTPGQGCGLYEVGHSRILVMNLQGRCEMAFGPDNPFLKADRILKEYEGEYDVALCEFHAGATSEKNAMGFYLDGRVAGVYGTHTHVQTADERVFPKGTGYITDIGMTGPVWSVLGVRPEQSIALFRGDLTSVFEPAEGVCAICGALLDVDEKSGRCRSIKRVYREV